MEYLVLYNIIVFIIYGIDKALSKKRKRRISEKALILLALLMGGVGATLGMIVFHHKVSKTLFRITIPLCLIVTIAFIYIHL